MEKKLKDCFGCLSKQKTPDKEAIRRYPLNEDEDAYLLEFGSPFLADAFQKISPSKAFRRLASKTQVLTSNINIHVRTRISHTHEVVSIATAIARILGLNESLCQAIALGHDMGHAPFGHLGEEFISRVTGKKFRHETFGLVIAQQIERKGQGLNLTHQVLDGILKHSRGAGSMLVDKNISPEASVVMFADKIAYIWADINDIFFRVKLFDISEFAELEKLINYFGKNQRARTAVSVKELCYESAEKGTVSFSEFPLAQIFSRVKDSMYSIYKLIDKTSYREILRKMLKRIYDFLSKSEIAENTDPAIILALMTDDDVFALTKEENISNQDFYKCSITEILPYLKGKNIDFTDPDLDW